MPEGGGLWLRMVRHVGIELTRDGEDCHTTGLKTVAVDS
jgi:hypothetical protein